MNIIKGSKHPKAEEKTMYEVSTVIGVNSSPFALLVTEKFTWKLHKNVKNQWKKVEGNIKYGKKVSYTFGEKVVRVTFKIEVYREGKELLGRSKTNFLQSSLLHHEPIKNQRLAE